MFTIRPAVCRYLKCIFSEKSSYWRGKENACRLFSMNSRRCASFKDRNSWVVLSDDGRTIVCWHPEVAPPYEHTKPLPKFEPEIQEHETVGNSCQNWNLRHSRDQLKIEELEWGQKRKFDRVKGDSVLKVQYRYDEKYRFKPGGPTVEELAKLTYTTKHRWYPNNDKKYLDPNPPVDRDGL